MPDPKKINQEDATAISRAAVQVMWTVDAAIDTGQLDAFKRAEPYLTPVYTAQLRTEAPGDLPASWRAHRAYAKVRLTRQPPESGVGPDSPILAHRQWLIVVTPTGRDGWTGPQVHAIAFVTLTRAAARGAWRVSTVTTA
ncbi:hypothetical protein [Actinomadura napierensis]|uniref:DUF4440 domain-containing protein n=1 Tax=Actinomadura napierensis TaxID=267854 RepID=A0ABP5LR31_9ACTN